MSFVPEIFSKRAKALIVSTFAIAVLAFACGCSCSATSSTSATSNTASNVGASRIETASAIDVRETIENAQQIDITCKKGAADTFSVAADGKEVGRLIRSPYNRTYELVTLSNDLIIIEIPGGVVSSKASTLEEANGHKITRLKVNKQGDHYIINVGDATTDLKYALDYDESQPDNIQFVDTNGNAVFHVGGNMVDGSFSFEKVSDTANNIDAIFALAFCHDIVSTQLESGGTAGLYDRHS